MGAWRRASRSRSSAMARSARIGRPAQYDATLDLSAVDRRHPLRAGGTGAVGEGRNAACRDRSAARRRGPGAGVRADGLRAAARRAAQGRGTIGGALAANLSGPRRIRPARRATIFSASMAVSGRGETFKSGGRVVKNVTGYDLCKLLAGSWGTLGIMTEVTLKVLPRPQTEATLRAVRPRRSRRRDRHGGRAWGRRSAFRARRTCPIMWRRDSMGSTRGDAATVFRIEGVGGLGRPSHRRARARGAAVRRPSASSTRRASRALWRAIRDVQPFWADGRRGDRALWRISTAPGKGCEVAAQISPAVAAVLRLGRRPHLGRAAGGAGLRRRRDPRRRRRGRRPCHAGARAGGGAGQRRCVPARDRRACRA